MESPRIRHLSGLYELLHDCTVAIKVPSESQGTGFFVGPGLILTCAEVVEAAQKGDVSIEVIWHGMTTTAQIQEFRDVSYPNLALLQVNLSDHPCVLLYGEAEPYGELYSYGFPDSGSPGKSTSLACEDWIDDGREALRFESGQVQQGMNGSPLLNWETGCVCGIAQIVRDLNVNQGGNAVLAKVAFRTFPGLNLQQQRFHQHDTRWLDLLAPEQRQQLEQSWLPQLADFDREPFLQHLRDVPLEDGRSYIQTHVPNLANPATIGILLENEAQRLLYSKPFISLKLSELLVFFGDYIHHAPSHASGLKAKGDVLVQIGHNQAALECLGAAGEEFLRLGDEGNWARSRITWVQASFRLGRIEEALQEGVHARKIFQRLGEDYWACTVDNNMAVIYTQSGQYQKALELYERLQVAYAAMADYGEPFIKRAIALVQMNQGVVLTWLGNFEQAYHLLDSARVSFVALEETNCVIQAEIHLADLDYVQGNYGSALRRYYEARGTAGQDNADDPIALASIMRRMANCLAKLNRIQEAYQLASEAVGIYRQTGISLDKADALREFATILVASGRLEEAVSTLNEAYAFFTQSGLTNYASITKLQQAELLLEMGVVDEAYGQCRFIKDYFDASGLISQSVRTNLVMAAALIKMIQQAGIKQEGQQIPHLQEATQLCEQATNLARQHNLQEQVYEAQYLLGQLAVIRGNLDEVNEYYRAAITQFERILDDLGYDQSSSFLQATWTLYEDMIALCLQRGQAEGAFSYLERARSIALRQYLDASKRSSGEGWLQRETNSLPEPQKNSALVLKTQAELMDWQERYRKYSSLLTDSGASTSTQVDRGVIQDELKRCEAKISELFERLQLYKIIAPATLRKEQRQTRERQSFDVTQLQQHLASDQLLLAYFLYKGRLVIFAVTPERLVVYENPDGATQLERLYLLLQAHLQPDGWPNPQQPPQYPIRRLLKRLYDLLVAPVADFLPSASGYLTIVPYGPLHGLPFHALYDGSHFLVENFRIDYLPASGFLTGFDISGSEQSVRIANMNDNTLSPLVFGYAGAGYLQGTLDEAKAVAALLGGNCYLEEEATIARLIERAPGSSIIHVATHGQSRLDAPRFSYVQLADGRLNTYDVFNLDLSGCELITLSGCETGFALSRGGEEQLGLGQAFLAAGADALVSNLWPVEDFATNELMQLFYRSLQNGESKALALCAAQRSLLHQEVSGYAHPYFWAGYRLIGNGRLPLRQVRRALNYYSFTLSVVRAQIMVGERLHLQVALRPAGATASDKVVVPADVTEVYCSVRADGLRVKGLHLAAIPIDPRSDEPASASFELEAHLRGLRSYTVELFVEEPRSGRLEIFRASGQVSVEPPIPGEERPALLPTLDVHVAPLPDFILEVNADPIDADPGSNHLTYRLSSHLPFLQLEHKKVGEVVLRAADLASIRRLIRCAVRQATNVQPEDSRQQMISLGSYLFDRLFPSDSASDFREIYWQVADRLTTWLIVEDGIASDGAIWLPWELVVPYRTDDIDSPRFLGERYHLSRWIEGLGSSLRLHNEIPIGEVALAHYKIVEQGQEDQDEELLGWRRLLKADLAYGIAQVVKPETPIFGLHLLRHSEQTAPPDITPRGGLMIAHSPEEEMPQTRLDLWFKRPLVTLGILTQDDREAMAAGSDDWPLPERARTFLQVGASALVGPWWPTSEEADQVFWPTFYDMLTRRMTLGEAVWRARLAVWHLLPHRPDWLAYALFGDPRARPYWPQPSEGYTALECINPDEPLRTAKTYYFRVSIRNRPPAWHEDRLVLAENLPREPRVVFLAPGLQLTTSEPIEMTQFGRTMVQATVGVKALEAGVYQLTARLLDGMERLQSLRVKLVVEETSSTEEENTWREAGARSTSPYVLSNDGKGGSWQHM